LGSCSFSKVKVRVANYATSVKTNIDVYGVSTSVQGSLNEVLVEEGGGEGTNLTVSSCLEAKIRGVVNMILFAGEPPG